jgi:hypothetical protein
VAQIVSVQRGRTHQAQQNAAWWFWITNCIYRTRQIFRVLRPQEVVRKLESSLLSNHF